MLVLNLLHLVTMVSHSLFALARLNLQCPQKGRHQTYAVTLSMLNRFSKLFHFRLSIKFAVD